jgi:LysM domain.
MIEIIYNEKKNEEKPADILFYIPKNIRQIGEAGKGKKIYIEDYAVTYLTQTGASNLAYPWVAILLGCVKHFEGVEYIFINGVLEVENMEVTSERISFNEQIWANIYSRMKEYFPRHEVLGWVLSVPGATLDITDTIYRAHLNNFSGNDKVFFMRETIEKEEAFYTYENGQLHRQLGYYIYYEKNNFMQEYMIQRNKGRMVENQEVISDRAIQNFRKIIEEKKAANTPPKLMTFMYSASVFLVMTVLVIGIAMINSHDKMKNMEQTLYNISRNLDVEAVMGQANIEIYKESEIENISEKQTLENEVEVENIVSGVVPLETEKETILESQAAPETQVAAIENAENVNVEQSPVIVYPTSINQEYIIQEGDTIFGISKNFYGTKERAEEICSINNITDVDKIYPGQKILLP